MRFSTAQLQELTNIRREQLRHWKKVLPPLYGRDGRGESYTFAEVLAIALLMVVIDELGISVSKLAGTAAELFALVDERIDIVEADYRIHLSRNGQILVDPPDDPVFVCVRLDRIKAELMDKLAPEQRRQLALPFQQ